MDLIPRAEKLQRFNKIMSNVTIAMGVKSLLALSCRGAPFLLEFYKKKQKELCDDATVRVKERHRRLIASLGFVCPNLFTLRLLFPEAYQGQGVGDFYTFGDVSCDDDIEFGTWHRNFELWKDRNRDGGNFTEEEEGLMSDDTDNPRHPCWSLRHEIEVEFAEAFFDELGKRIQADVSDVKEIVERNRELKALVSEIQRYSFWVRYELEKRLSDFKKQYEAHTDPGVLFALQSLTEAIDGEVKVRVNKRLLESLINQYWELLLSKLESEDLKGIVEVIMAEISDLTGKINYHKEPV